MNAMRAALILFSAAVACGAEPIERTDEALLQKLLREEGTALGEEPAAALPATAEDKAAPEAATQSRPAFAPEAIEQLLGGLRLAEERLGSRETGEATRQAQSKVIDELERLIEAAKSSRTPKREEEEGGAQNQSLDATGKREAGNPEPAHKAGTPEETSAGVSAGPAAVNRAGKAEESSNRPLEARPRAGRVAQSHPEDLQEEWGHLPPRLREQLRNTGSDRYLPQYDDLSRRYFESLARPADAR